MCALLSDRTIKLWLPSEAPDEEHLDVPSTGATKLHQECEDPDESGSEYSNERSDEESEASADVVGGPERWNRGDQRQYRTVIRREVPLSCQS